MMPIANPNGAFGYDPQEQAVGDYIPISCLANAAITAGQSVAWMAVTSSVKLQVEPWDVSDANPLVFAGVALEDAAAGEIVQVARIGWVLATFSDADTPAFGEAVLIGTEDGKLASTARAAGQAQLGVVLGAKLSGSQKAPVWLFGGTAAVTA